MSTMKKGTAVWSIRSVWSVPSKCLGRALCPLNSSNPSNPSNPILVEREEEGRLRSKIRFEISDVQLFLDQVGEAILNFIMTGYRDFLSISRILVNIMFLSMTQKETPVLDQITKEDIPFQAATSISFTLISGRSRTGSVSSISW